MSNMGFKYSASAVGTYMTCPRKFKLIYLDKKQTFKPKCMADGVLLHSWFDKFYKEMPPIQDLDINKFDEYAKIFPQELRESYEEDIYNFLEFSKKLFLISENKACWKPIATEEKFYDEEMNFVGVIDAVFSDGTNYLLLDYKTGKPKDKLTDSYQLQLCGYKHLWDRRYPDQKITHWGNLYTKGEINEINPIIETVSLEKMNEFYINLDKVKNEIEAGNFCKTKNKFWCKKCELAIYCFGDIDSIKEGWR